jgi:DNA-binding MarR family transcriptional regulator
MSRPTLQRVPLARTIDRESYVLAYLNLVANGMSSLGSRRYLREFGIGINEWRVVSSLGNIPGGTAGDIADLVGIHKSVVSRSLRALIEAGLVGQDPELGKRRLFLTAAGAALHDKIVPVALAREDLLLHGFDDEEIVLLRGFLRRMHDNLERVAKADEDGFRQA